MALIRDHRRQVPAPELDEDNDYFPQTYAHATWGRLLPFFQLPGRVTVDQNAVSVTLRPFNDKQLNQDLNLLCERVRKMAPRLPDGKQLLFTVGNGGSPSLDQHKQRVAGNPADPVWKHGEKQRFVLPCHPLFPFDSNENPQLDLILVPF